MITVSLNNILYSVPIFRDISNKPLPVKVAYQVARLIRELDQENATFDESRRQIIEKYAERNEDGSYKQTEEGNIIIKSDKITICNNEMSELLDTQIQINVEPLQIEDFSTIELTPVQMLNLEPFFNT